MRIPFPCSAISKLLVALRTPRSRGPAGRRSGLAVGIALGLLAWGVRPVLAAEVPFERRIIGTIPGSPASVFAADVDGDGDLDTLGASFGASSSTSLILWGENTSGDGSTWDGHVVAQPSGAFSAHAADVDGDGDVDLLGAAANADDILWWENTSGDGSTWIEHTVAPNFDNARSVHAADVDGDGDIDVLGAASNAHDVTWWENDSGDGTSWTEHTIDGDFDGAFSVWASDVDGDGDLDVLGAASHAATFAWWENHGDGSLWTEHTIDTSSNGARSVVGADVDGDGDVDVLTAAANDDDVTWWENTLGDGTTWTGHVVAGDFVGASSVFAADIDGDGDTDVLGAAQIGDAVAWFENTSGDGSAWAEHAIDGAFDGARSIYAADLDGDGDADVLGAAASDDDAIWWENETIHRSAVFPEAVPVDDAFDGAVSVHAADVDGDGDADVLGAARDAGEITWWEDTAGDGSTWTAHLVDGAFGGAHSVRGADVDADGDTDLLGAAFFDDEVAWWENTAGDGSAWTKRPVDNSFDAAIAVATADVDGDGDVDVLGASALGDQIVWWKNIAGNGCCWLEHIIDASFVGAMSVAAGDVDGDGDVDVLGAATGDDDIAWWENTTGDGTAWTEHAVAADFEGAVSVAAADLDGDGDLDVLGAAGEAGVSTWWENVDGDGSVWAEHAVGGAFTANAVYAGDLDGDGDADLLAASFEFDSLAWWRNRGGQFALRTEDVAPARGLEGATQAVLAIDAHHRGRTGDQDVELATLELLLDDGTTPLTDAQADALLAELAVYLDDGSGVFEPGLDTLVESVTSLTLSSGVLTVPFGDGDGNVAISFGSPKTWFVALTFELGASTSEPDEIRVTHLTESSSTGEDADHDLPVTLEFAADTPSSVVLVNEAPVAVADMVELLEDSGTVAGNVLDGTSGGLDSDGDLDPLAAVLLSDPSGGMLIGGLEAGGGFVYQPDPDFYGEDAFVYAADDGYETGNSVAVTVTVTPVNDQPSFLVLSSVAVGPGAGPQSIPGFAFGIVAGPPNEAGQTLAFETIGNTDPGLFSEPPTLSIDGTLSFTPAPSAIGTATITVQLMDDGGTANGGVDTSSPRSFDIEIGVPIFADGFESGDTSAWSSTRPFSAGATR